ncbi:UNVERIFIED_CONTAM: hypothetical protein Slati_3406600 [Sesamum latifolium]|uniref:SWIM-type domain-containing protein n=1 Tax=Sesamum latifolium TaxID=2727402 RepID=A0AAW2UGK5_9LAMI
MYETFKQKFKGAELKEYFWKAASTANKQEFRAYMKKITEIDPKKTADQVTAAEWLNARDKPIITMLERIRTKLMTRLQHKRLGMEKYEGIVCSNVLKKINKQGKLARHCFSRWCGEEEFEIDHFTKRFVVDLDKKTCTCGMFQLTAYPCCHDMRHQIEDYVDSCYKKPAYLKVYENMIHGVPGQEEYIQMGSEPLNAPKFKKKRGRLVKQRKKGPNEV